MPEPADVKDALLPPGAFGWGESLPAVRDFIVNPEACWKKTADTLEKMLTTGGG